MYTLYLPAFPRTQLATDAALPNVLRLPLRAEMRQELQESVAMAHYLPHYWHYAGRFDDSPIWLYIPDPDRLFGGGEEDTWLLTPMTAREVLPPSVKSFTSSFTRMEYTPNANSGVVGWRTYLIDPGIEFVSGRFPVDTLDRIADGPTSF